MQSRMAIECPSKAASESLHGFTQQGTGQSVTRQCYLRPISDLKCIRLIGGLVFLAIANGAFAQGGWPFGGGFGGPYDSQPTDQKFEPATDGEIEALVSKLGPGLYHRMMGCTPPPAWGFGSPADETAAHLVRIGPPVIPFILKRRTDKDEATRALVIEVLARIKDAKVVPVLIDACHNDPSDRVRVSATEGLSWSSDPRAAPALVPALFQVDHQIQMFAIRALTRYPQEPAIDPLVKLMRHAAEGFPSIGPSIISAQLAEQGAYALGAIGPDAFPSIIQLIHSPDGAVCKVGELALTECNDHRSLPELWRLCGDPDDMMRLHAACALGRWTDPQSIIVLTRLMRTGRGNACGMAAQSLARMGGPALDPFFAAAKDPVYSEMVSSSFMAIGDRRAAKRLLDMLKSPIARVRELALYKLSMWSDPGALLNILEMTHDSDMEKRRLAVGMLGFYNDRKHPEIIESLLRAMTDKHEWVRAQAAGALCGKHDARILPAMKRLVKSPIKDVPPLAQLVINQYRP